MASSHTFPTLRKTISQSLSWIQRLKENVKENKNICKGSIATVDTVRKYHNLSYTDSPTVSNGLTHATLQEGSVAKVDAVKKCHNLSYTDSPTVTDGITHATL